MKAANPSHAEALVLVDEMVRAGIEHACLSPGSRSAPLALALADEGRIQLHVVLDERSCSFLALGIAKATRRAVPVVCTSGTAAANFFPSIIEAHHSRTPLLILTADRPVELRETGASQTIDQTKMYGDAVRWFFDLGVAEDAPHSNALWRSTLARAVAVAEGGPAGPVHLNLPFREPLVPDGPGFEHDLSGRSGGAPWMSVTKPAHVLGDEEVSDLIERISGKKGLIVAGAGHHGDGLLALAERLDWPLLAEASSGQRHGDRTVTAYDSLLRVPSWADAHRPEVVFRFGSVTLSKSLAGTLRRAEQILVEPDGWWHDPGRAVARLVKASAQSLVEAFGDRVRPAPAGWAAQWSEADALARKAIDAVLDSGGISEPRTARDLVTNAPDGSNIVVAASMPLRDIESFAPKRSDVRFLSNRGANGIDGFVSTAAGIAQGSAAPTFALCGDLSFLHDQNGLMALRTATTPVTFVVVNNDGGGIFSFLPQAAFPDRFEQVFGTPHGLDLAKICAVHDLEHLLISDPHALASALGTQRSTVVEVRTERSANVALHAELHEAVARAVG